MKVIRADLTAEGRLDILEKVMAYRGGLSIDPSNETLTLMEGTSRVYASGNHSYLSGNWKLMNSRTVAGSSVKRFLVNYLG